MASILWIVVGFIACVWAASMAVTAALAMGAHRGDPRVVVDDPWEQEHAQRDLDRLRTAVARARAEARSREGDFSRWERDLHQPGPRLERITPRRPRPAA